MTKIEELTKMIEDSGITSVESCCGVPHKFCNNDVWKGHLPTLAMKIEEAAIRRCIAFIRNGSFLHDQAPPKLFANEVTKAMEADMLPATFFTPKHVFGNQCTKDTGSVE